MKNYILPALIMTVCCVLLFSGIYTLAVWGVAQFAPNQGRGEIISYGLGDRYGFSNVGQSFTFDRYFSSRPSAAGYNAAASSGSNKGPSNPEYLTQVQARMDSFLVHNPGVKKREIPADLVTASGSGLDPDISPEAARVQVDRIAKARGISAEKVALLVRRHTIVPLFIGTSTINLLRLNIALDNIK